MRVFNARRKKTMQQGRMRKFMAYALGEIILIMIGILGAIQLNNWNESRKTEEREHHILREIQADLSSTRKEIAKDLSFHQVMVERTEKLEQILRGERMVDSVTAWRLECIMNDFQVYPKTSGFEMLRTTGGDLISNDGLRKEIYEVFELDIPRVTEVGKMGNDLMNLQTYLHPFLLKHCAPLSTPFEFQPKEGEKVFTVTTTLKSEKAFLEDDELRISLGLFKKFRDYKVKKHKDCLPSIDNLLSQIDAELSERFE